MRNGVPFDVAFSLGNTMRTAWSIVFSEMEGNAFNWNTLRFVEDKS